MNSWLHEQYRPAVGTIQSEMCIEQICQPQTLRELKLIQHEIHHDARHTDVQPDRERPARDGLVADEQAL